MILLFNENKLKMKKSGLKTFSTTNSSCGIKIVWVGLMLHMQTYCVRSKGSIWLVIVWFEYVRKVQMSVALSAH